MLRASILQPNIYPGFLGQMLLRPITSRPIYMFTAWSRESTVQKPLNPNRQTQKPYVTLETLFMSLMGPTLKKSTLFGNFHQPKAMEGITRHLHGGTTSLVAACASASAGFEHTLSTVLETPDARSYYSVGTAIA